HAGAHQHVHRDAGLGQGFEEANVAEAPGRTAAQHEGHGGPLPIGPGGRGRPAADEEDGEQDKSKDPRQGEPGAGRCEGRAARHHGHDHPVLVYAPSELSCCRRARPRITLPASSLLPLIYGGRAPWAWARGSGSLPLAGPRAGACGTGAGPLRHGRASHVATISGLDGRIPSMALASCRGSRGMPVELVKGPGAAAGGGELYPVGGKPYMGANTMSGFSRPFVGPPGAHAAKEWKGMAKQKFERTKPHV